MASDLVMWGVFILLAGGLILFDLGFWHRHQPVISPRESLKTSACYLALGLLFGGWIWWSLGPQKGQDYLTAFLVEKSLSLDNIFVISMIFTSLSIPPQHQHRVLFYGLAGVIVLRGIMIGLGAHVVHHWSWVLNLFAAFLIITGLKMLLLKAPPSSLQDHALFRFLKRYIPVTSEVHGQDFVVRQPHPRTGSLQRMATPLLLALIMIETSDVLFAMDSIPAVFSITSDTYIVYTSNIFAVLGLRALYFGLASLIHRFEPLKDALSVLLIFIGAKVLVPGLFDVPPLSSGASLGISVAILGGGMVYAWYKTRDKAASKL